MKRMFDFSVALVSIVVLSPLLLVVAGLILLAMGRPVLFRQDRPGKHGKVFTLYKFRTMRTDKDKQGTTLADAQRLTRLGRFLRGTSMDELPELLNVLRGDMSLVGPRPLLTQYLELYTPEQMRRHEVRPGITGWAQVNGRNELDWEKRFELDVWYVDHRTFWLDLWILALTVWRVLKRDGIAHPQHATMPQFQGSGQAMGEPR